MNGNYTPNVFKYSNQQYTLLITLFTMTGDKKNDLQISLDAVDIEQFIYENKMNDLLIKGKVIYTDKYAAIDKMLNQQYCYCEVLFAQNARQMDNDIGAGKIDEKKKFTHNFIVTNIKILARNASIIKYEIDLMSVNWFKCSANISYSNYGKTPEPLFDIVKSCITNNNLAIDDDSFNRVKSPVAMNWISKQNDNLFSALKYLMHKMYYMKDFKDDSLKFIVYDQFDDKYRLVDIKDKYTLIGSFGTTLSFFKTNTEALIQQEPTNLGSFKSPFSKNNLYSSLFDKHMQSYDLNYDKVQTTVTESKTLANYLNASIDNDNYEQKYVPMFTYPNMNHLRIGSYWENDFDVYNESIDALEQNNALILNITGNLMRQPGSMNVITIDRGLENITTDDKREIEKLKKKYKAYEGVWIASKVRNIVCPALPSFRQQVALFRNFIPKMTSTT